MVRCTGPSIDNAETTAAFLASFFDRRYPISKYIIYVRMFLNTSEIALNILPNN